jgi:hypothetical protein
MTDIGFAPKETIEPDYQRLEVLSAETTETYGPQLALKMKVVGGEHDGYTFTDYANRDQNTGKINEGSKAWSIFEACLGPGFHKRGASLRDLVGKEFVAKVEKTKTGSRNKLEHGTIGPVPPASTEASPDKSRNPSGSEPDEEGFEDSSF